MFEKRVVKIARRRSTDRTEFRDSEVSHPGLMSVPLVAPLISPTLNRAARVDRAASITSVNRRDRANFQRVSWRKVC